MDNINAKSISFCMTISIYKGQFIKVIGPQQNCWSCDHMMNFQFMKKICLYFCLGQMILVGIESTIRISLLEVMPEEGSHVAHLNFKTSHVSVYKCLSLIVGFSVTVTIWPREVVSCRDFILVVLSLVFGPRRLSEFTLAGPLISVDFQAFKSQKQLLP